ncbi:MAG: aminoglycoside 6-adenylyltransferase, partial [Candidatus Eisenbacteria sp.]|nr:aminoglycoside 6-adenylyltransferase [Candidatus Eisenbacteria bacterium]
MISERPQISPPDRDLVLERFVRWASARDAVRSVLLTSTRANPDTSTDLLSDYDVILAVTDVRPFFEDRSWLGDFGPVLVVYRDPVRPREGGESFAYITQYENGLKIDFSLWSVGVLSCIAENGELPDDLDVGYAVLIDKDGLTDRLPEPTRRAYVPDPPSEDAYLTLVEEFLHEATYVAKHLWRDDLLPAKYNLDHAMKQRDLRKMLNWLVETNSDWGVPVSAYGKGLKERLPSGIWGTLESTYAGAGIEENWNALLATMDLFREVAIEVGGRLGFDYPHELDGRVCRYLEGVRTLR